ncbi:MAG: VCBS repeat-containing protein [Planctomycetaceae bacterium]|nr:VCBS repeat-containing protein [Planctomycetaceae bacterium]
MFFKHLRTWLANAFSSLVAANPQRRYRRRGWWVEGLEDRTLLSIQIENTGLAGILPDATGFPVKYGPVDHTYVWIYETDQGDLNGDNDKLDTFIGFANLNEGTIDPVNLAIQKRAVTRWNNDRTSVVFYVSEQDQSEDLDGDGYQRGSVPYVYSFVSKTATRVEGQDFVVNAERWSPNGRYLWLDRGQLPAVVYDTVTMSSHVTVSDTYQQRAFWSNSGDFVAAFEIDSGGDSFLTTFDATNTAAYQTGLGVLNTAEITWHANLPIAGVPVSESVTGVDLNLDGDLDDNVLHFVNAASRTTQNTMFATDRSPIWSSTQSKALVSLDEVGQQQDLNNDGDTNDKVFAVYDSDSGAIENLQLDWAFGSWSRDGTLLILTVNEDGQSQDLNGDGDSADEVLYVYDTVTGQLHNSRLAYDALYEFDLNPSEDLLFFSVNESLQGQDLDGDGLIEDKRSPHVWRRETGRFEGLGVTVEEPWWQSIDQNYQRIALNVNGRLQVYDIFADQLIDYDVPVFRPRWSPNGDSLLFGIDEQVAGDLDGDGQADDIVAHVYDLNTHNLVNLQVAMWCSVIHWMPQGRFVFIAYHDCADLRVTRYEGTLYDSWTDSSISLGQVTSSSISNAAGTIIAFVYSEIDGSDLNGDGDTRDLILGVFDAVTGEVHNTNVNFVNWDARWSSNGENFLFSTVEDGVDLNGDGDTTDVVLQFLRNEPPALDVSQTVTSLNELDDTSVAIKMADVGIVDDALGVNVLSLSGTDAALFELINGELFLKSGVSLDFETQPQLHVTIELDDAGIGSGIEDFVDLTLDVLDGNEAPSFTLTQVLFSLPENDAGVAMTKVADLAIIDDALGTNLFSVSGDDALLFEVVGNALYLRDGAVLDFESNRILNVTVELDDPALGGGPEQTADLTINLTDVLSDGEQDAVVFDPATNRWWSGRNAGGELQWLAGPQWTSAVEWQTFTGDVNGDGLLDGIGFNSRSGMFAALNNGHGGLLTVSMGSFDPALSFQHVMVGDFDGNGTTDVLAQGPRGEWFSRGWDGTQFVTKFYGRYTPVGWAAFRAGDFNGDGADDIIGVRNSVDNSKTIFFYGISRQLPVGRRFSGSYAGRLGQSLEAGGWHNFTVGDFNGDNRDDLLLEHQGGQLWIATSTSGPIAAIPSANYLWLSAGTLLPPAWVGRPLMVGDFNGDGLDDVVARAESTAGDDANKLFVALTSLTAPPRVVRLDGEVWGQLNPADDWSSQAIVGDFNGDGRSDYATWNLTAGSTNIAFATTNAFTSLIPFGASPNWTNPKGGAGLVFPVA